MNNTQTVSTNVFKTGIITVVLIGIANKKGTHIYPLHTQSYTYTKTCITHTLTHTHIVTQSTQTAPRRVPLQLPPLYYWSIWRLLSQG